MRRKGRAAFIIIGIMMLAGAAGLALFNVWDDYRAGNEAAAVAEFLSAQISENSKEQFFELELPGVEKSTDMETIEKECRLYVGTIELPSYDIKLPVLSEWSDENLRISPCRYNGSCYTNDLVICAHNYSSHFNSLRWIALGDEVRFTTVKGETFDYIVTNRETLNPTEIERMIDSESDWDLTLFTCYPGGATRCVVRCEMLG